jgi:hypothetical protein
MRSAFVRQEWEYALELRRPHFVRPTHWEIPLPSSEAEDLPPEELRRLHFHRMVVAPRADTPVASTEPTVHTVPGSSSSPPRHAGGKAIETSRSGSPLPSWQREVESGRHKSPWLASSPMGCILLVLLVGIGIGLLWAAFYFK